MKHITPLAAALLFCAGAACAATPYTADAKRSTLGFVATQTGAPVEGRFGQFRADIVFSADDLPGSRFDVTITVKSADTGEDDRDETLRGPDLFAVEKYPTARFVTTAFKHVNGSRYEATGKLTLRNVTREIRLPFTFESTANEASLQGGVKLNRLDYGIGQGEWKDTTWVANEVTVKFALRLLPANKKSTPQPPHRDTAK